MTELLYGLAGVVATFAIYSVFYAIKDGRRQRAAQPRHERFAVTGAARIHVSYEDRPNRNLPAKATLLNGSFTLRIEGRAVIAESSTPALLGDPRTFWSCLLTDLRQGGLPHVEIDGDSYLLARLSFPPDGRVLLRFIAEDLAIIRQVESVGGAHI